ncbi:MAG: polysaccharide deacetylase family protein [Ignavibacteriaceae bacterium]
MAVDQYRQHKSNLVAVLFSGIIVIGLALLVYLFVLKSVYGRFSTDDMVPDFGVLKNFIFGSDAKVAILYSDYTKNMMTDGSSWLEDNVETWKKFLDNIDLKYNIINDETIEKNLHKDYELIILPGSKSLSDREIINIKKFLIDGGSIFATSGTASYSDAGKWRGWEFFSEVFGVKHSKEIGDEDRTRIHTLRGGLPLTANIPTGFPLRVATWDKPLAVEVLDPRTTQVSFWYNYRLEDGLVREGIQKSAGIAYGTYGKGRFVWMGFEINSIIGSQDDYVFFDRFFNNSINWLTYGPIAYIRDWPAGIDAAAVILPSLTKDAANIINLLPVLEQEKLKATFFVNPSQNADYKNLVKQVSRYGEIAPLVDVGYMNSSEDKYNKLYDYESQLQNLKAAKNWIESITNKPVRGILPFYGLYDNNTINAVIESGYEYIITDSLTDRSVPKTVVRGEDRIVSLTKTARDDYEIIRDFGLTSPEFQFYTYQEDLDRILFEGGLYLFKMHTEFQCRAENIQVVHSVIKELKKKKFWITTASQIQKWFEKKEYIETRTKKSGKTRVTVTVTNPGKEIIDDLVLDIDLNENAEKISIDTEIIGTKLAKYKHVVKSRFLNLQIDDLEPGESRTYYIDYDKVRS